LLSSQAGDLEVELRSAIAETMRARQQLEESNEKLLSLVAQLEDTEKTVDRSEVRVCVSL